MKNKIKGMFSRYNDLPKEIAFLLLADFFLQIINAAFTLSLNYFMLDSAYKDYEITSLTGNRYLMVLLASVPLAMFAKGKTLKPFLLTGSIASPIIALLLIAAISFHQSQLIRLLMGAWGISFSFLQILAMPYILQKIKKENVTPAITLFFLIGNITTIIVGGINYILPTIHPFFNTKINLIIFSLAGFLGVYFILKLPNEKIAKTSVSNATSPIKYDWPIIIKAIIPTFLIAFGAGFTIPFINLFFYQVHGMSAHYFSLMNMIAFSIVTIAVFFSPHIKDKMGLKWGIVLFQSLGIIVLFLLGTTEWYAQFYWGFVMAVGLFIIRQPLMTIAAPMTSELTMHYVGEKNREITSAIIAAIWSGSWFISAILFSIFREMKIAYSNIIFITVGFYIVGVIWYLKLINDFEKKKDYSASTQVTS